MTEKNNKDLNGTNNSSFSELINKNNPKIIGSNIENLLWGFNPNELLNEIIFPNEKEEYLIRRVKKIRRLAVKNISLTDQEVDFFLECFNRNLYYPLFQFINSPEYLNFKNNTNNVDDHSKEFIINFCNGINITYDYLKLFDYLYNSLDKKNVSVKNDKNDAPNKLPEMVDIFNTDKQLKIFLTRSAASVTIQTHWRMYITRKKYYLVMYGELSFITNTNSTERNPNMPYLPSVTDLSVQVNIEKFNNINKKNYVYMCIN